MSTPWETSDVPATTASRDAGSGLSVRFSPSTRRIAAEISAQREPHERGGEEMAGGDELDERRAVGAEDDAAVGGDDAGDDGLDAGHGREVVHAVIAEVVVADVGDDGGVAAVDGEAAAQDAAARDLEDREVDVAVAQDGAGGGGSGPVAGLEQALVDRHAVG